MKQKEKAVYTKRITIRLKDQNFSSLRLNLKKQRAGTLANTCAG